MVEKHRYFFKIGEEVVHKEATSQKLFIEEILKEFYNTINEKGEPERQMKICGIRCHWWDANKNFHTAKFHKAEILPYDVAYGAEYTEILKWLEENNPF